LEIWRRAQGEQKHRLWFPGKSMTSGLLSVAASIAAAALLSTTVAYAQSGGASPSEVVFVAELCGCQEDFNSY
jgi:hypothetical protein